MNFDIIYIGQSRYPCNMTSVVARLFKEARKRESKGKTFASDEDGKYNVESTKAT